MTNVPPDRQAADDAPHFQHDAIEIRTEELEPNLIRVEAMVTEEQTMLFQRQLAEVSDDLSKVNLAELMVHVIIEESMDRLERRRFWDPFPVADQPRPTFRPGTPFTITIDVPAFRAPDWTALSELRIKLPRHEATEATIDREILDQRLDAGERSPSDAPIAALDEVTLDVEGHVGEEVTRLHSDLVVRMPLEGEELTIGGATVPGARAALDGASRGEHRSLKQTTDASKDGRSLSFIVRDIQRIHPATLEQVLENYGIRAEPILRLQIKLAIEQRYEEERLQRATNQLMPLLHQRFKYEIPEKVQTFLTRKARDEQMASWEKSGLDQDAIAARLETFDAEASDRAKAIARETVLLNFLQEHLQISLHNNDLDEAIQTEAALRGVRPEAYRAEMLDESATNQLRSRVVRKKVVASLLKVVTIEEV